MASTRPISKLKPSAKHYALVTQRAKELRSNKKGVTSTVPATKSSSTTKPSEAQSAAQAEEHRKLQSESQKLEVLIEAYNFKLQEYTQLANTDPISLSAIRTQNLSEPFNKVANLLTSSLTDPVYFKKFEDLVKSVGADAIKDNKNPGHPCVAFAYLKYYKIKLGFEDDTLRVALACNCGGTTTAKLAEMTAKQTIIQAKIETFNKFLPKIRNLIKFFQTSLKLLREQDAKHSKKPVESSPSAIQKLLAANNDEEKQIEDLKSSIRKWKVQKNDTANAYEKLCKSKELTLAYVYCPEKLTKLFKILHDKMELKDDEFRHWFTQQPMVMAKERKDLLTRAPDLSEDDYTLFLKARNRYELIHFNKDYKAKEPMTAYAAIYDNKYQLRYFQQLEVFIKWQIDSYADLILGLQKSINHHRQQIQALPIPPAQTATAAAFLPSPRS